MGTIAKGEITLSPVNDAYTVLLTPSSCSISADFDGSNPNLTNAKGSITVKRGTKIVPFKVNQVIYSASCIKASWSTQEVTTMPFVVTQIPNTVLDGYIEFHITTQDGFNYSTEVQFSFNIVRESTMLDWIQDWEGSKTKVGGTYIMTPKLFVGKKEAVLDTTGSESTWKEGALTGVYIGPDLLASGESSVGIYGYLKDEKIFHINADGGFIGGWTFNEGGLQSANGVVNILSEGSIYAQNPDSEIPYWGIYANGTASFANGNVKFLADGSAEFAGKITSISGAIGGWNITKNQLCSGRIFLDSSEGLIGINASKIQHVDELTGAYIFPETPDGGLKLWYSSATDFGMAGWTTGEKVFQLGSVNFIAGWSFNHQAIWTGAATPSLTQGGYTSDSNALTIAPNGIRSSKWYVDSNGTASFVGGLAKFNTDNAEMFGWLMRSGRFSSNHAALISDPFNGGVYISITDITEVSSGSLRTIIANNGGIYLYSDGINAIMRAYDESGKIGFSLNTSGYNSISSWSFDPTAIYISSKDLTQDGFTTKDGSMVLMASGIFGYKWKLLADGSGALAGGKIVWNKDGDITVDAKISANNITAGTISTATIKNSTGTWSLNQDGSGKLGGGNISWLADGTLTVKNSNLNNVIITGSVRTPFVDGYATLGESGPVVVSTLGIQNNNCVVIPGSGGGFYTNFSVPFTSKYNGFRVIILNYHWGNTKTSGPISASAPKGYYFYENGEPLSELIINQYEMVEMIGIGEGDTFNGWLVLNRQLYNYNDVSGSPVGIGEGFTVKAMYAGKIDCSGSYPSLVRQKRWDQNMYGHENNKLYISYPINGDKYITIHIPDGVFSSADKYDVILTGHNDANANVYACVKDKTANSFTVYTGDDSSFNAGGFTFLILGTWFWK